jgi:hypothetical protein
VPFILGDLLKSFSAHRVSRHLAGRKRALGRIPKPAERFEAAETLLAYGWGRPPQYVDLTLASSEVKRIEVTLHGHA